MRIIELSPPAKKVAIPIDKDKTTEDKTFDIAKLHQINPELIKQLYINTYKKHLETVTALVVSRIALNSAMSDAERHITQATSNGNTPPVQINTEENVTMMDIIFAKALREYAINASAEIAIENPEIRKEYINNYNSKAPILTKSASATTVGIRKSQSDIEEEHKSGIDHVSNILDRNIGQNKDVTGPYGAVEKERHDGKLPIVRQSVRSRLPK